MNEDRQIIDMFYAINRYLQYKSIQQHKGGWNTFKGQGKILSILAYHYPNHKAMSQKGLQKHMQITSSSLGEQLTKLEEQGLIIRKQNPDDKRGMLVSITNQGLEAYDAMNNSETRFELLEDLNPEDKTTLKNILEKLQIKVDQEDIDYEQLRKDRRSMFKNREEKK